MGLADPGMYTMKKKMQLSLAQALGNLSNEDRLKLLGKKVFFYRTHTHNSVTHKDLMPGSIVDLHKVSGYVIVQDEKGNHYSRSLTNVWGDICE